MGKADNEMKIEIPEYGTLQIDALFLDFNGTIAVDGFISEPVKERLRALGEKLEIFVLTADTHGNARTQCEGLPVILRTFPQGSAKNFKREMIRSRKGSCCAAIGNGRNDEDMLKEAVFSVAVLDQEGAYGKLIGIADLCVRSMEDGLDLFLKPHRIVAGLRG